MITLQIELHIRFEGTSDGSGIVWWADSPQLPGLYILEETLDALLATADTEVRDVVAETDPEAAVAIVAQLVPLPSVGDHSDIAYQGDVRDRVVDSGFVVVSDNRVTAGAAA